jgi:hypothetical protein
MHPVVSPRFASRFASDAGIQLSTVCCAGVSWFRWASIHETSWYQTAHAGCRNRVVEHLSIMVQAVLAQTLYSLTLMFPPTLSSLSHTHTPTQVSALRRDLKLTPQPGPILY